MPKKPTPTKPKRETWRDWMPEGFPQPSDEELVTRSELLDRLRSDPQRTIDITERTLRLWESEGILPGPIRQRHKGATRALYPPWYATLVIYADLGKYSRRPEGLAVMVRELTWRAILTNELDQFDVMKEQLPDALGELADRYQELMNERPAMAVVTLLNKAGQARGTFAWDLS